ncbi:Hypothetical protein CINCED_3A015589 [Cinara cedri]|uniref:Uncharacterized protein n=1 Tax=Cinara cedri TaxID=506608 RepID=A0A5E4MRJ7_9HEMI|nr:Hypothetical protein CINCED_3A015589 [Cinara cedri]
MFELTRTKWLIVRITNFWITICAKNTSKVNENLFSEPSSLFIQLDSVESSEADCQDSLWLSEWTSVQWTEKKEKFKGLYCTDGKIGCDICRKVSKLKTPQKIEISQEWVTCEIDGGTNTNKKTCLTVLKNKLKKHFESNAHKSAVQILDNKDKNMLSKLMEENDYQIN